MNNRDRRLLERVHACLAIPFGAAGTQSETIRGIARFEQDMRYALPIARELLRWIATEEPYEGAINEDLTNLETWFRKRTTAEWH